MANKIKSKLFLHISITISVLFCFSTSSLGQDKISLSAGIGILEFANVGVRYQIKQSQIGVSAGIYPTDEESIWSIAGDLHLHLGELSNLSSRKPWYFRFGFVYVQNDNSTGTGHKNYYLSIRFGREINFSKKVGLYIDFGFNIDVEKSEVKKTPEEGPTGGAYQYPFIPAIGIGIGIFFKI